MLIINFIPCVALVRRCMNVLASQCMIPLCVCLEGSARGPDQGGNIIITKILLWDLDIRRVAISKYMVEWVKILPANNFPQDLLPTCFHEGFTMESLL